MTRVQMTFNSITNAQYCEIIARSCCGNIKFHSNCETYPQAPSLDVQPPQDRLVLGQDVPHHG